MEQSAANVLVCRCALAQRLPQGAADGVISGLRDAGIACQVVDDLCAACAAPHQLAPDEHTGGSSDEHAHAADGKGVAPDLPAVPPIVIACRPRAVRWLLHYAGIELAGDAVLLDLRGTSPRDVLAAALSACEQRGPAPDEPTELPPPDAGWMPWFPVIDRDRCVDCKQCLSFCLFGTYELDRDGRVVVARPANCKTWCPACARLCPQSAIIFPKYDSGPISGEDGDANAAGGPVRVELPQADGDDLLDALRKRMAPPAEPFATGPAARQAEMDRLRYLDAADGVDLASLAEELKIRVDGHACACEGGDCQCDCDDGGCGADCDCHNACEEDSPHE